MSSIGDLENKILQMGARFKELEDERSIREVLSRYGYNADNGRDQAYVDPIYGRWRC